MVFDVIAKETGQLSEKIPLLNKSLILKDKILNSEINISSNVIEIITYKNICVYSVFEKSWGG